MLKSRAKSLWLIIGKNMKVLEGSVAAPNAKVAVVIARFNSFINESLLEGAIDALKRIGQVKDENITIVRAPGAYELPLVARRLAESKKFDAIVALGTVIRGGTAHFEYVAGEASSGLGKVAMDAEIPVAFGVLTTENIEQAIERAGTKAGNKGAEAALTALEMVNLIQQIDAAEIMTEQKQVKKPSARRRARECTVQALYSWAVSGNTAEQVELAFVLDQDMDGVDKPYFRKLFRQTIENIETVDFSISPYIDRTFDELDPIETAILRLAVYELHFELDVPYKVVINEAIEVAKVFGADESHKYINGVLDKIAPALGRK